MKATIELELYKSYAAKLEAELIAILSAKYGHKPSIHAHFHSLWIDAVEETLNIGEGSAEND